MGNHANYALPGIHSRFVGSVIVNDITFAVHLWDPILSAYLYIFTPSSSRTRTFTSPGSSAPVSWLKFLGHWGDKQYPDSDPRQINFLNLNVSWRYEWRPTGPLDKDLNRTQVCPNNGDICTTLSALPVAGDSYVATATGTVASGTVIVTGSPLHIPPQLRMSVRVVGLFSHH